MDWNRLRYRPGQAPGHYESYYLRANHPARARAFWIRYTIFSPANRSEAALGEVWAVGFDAEHGHAAVKAEVPLAQCRFAAAGLDVEIGTAALGASSLRGEVAAGGHRVAWDLRYAGSEPPLLFMAPAHYDAPFPAAKSVVVLPLAQFDGTLTVDGVRWDVAGWRGSQNHNWGVRHTDRYAFGQVCGFDDSPSTFLEVASARVRVGPILTPTLSPLVLRHEGRDHAFITIPQALRAKASRAGLDWRFATGDAALRIEGRISAPAGAFVGLRYYNPPGGVKHCLNSKIARCELTLTRAGGAVQKLSSLHGTLFEILGDHPHPEIAVAA